MTGFDFSPLFRSSIGFDRLNRLMESNLAPSVDSYPPYNIEKLGEDRYRIAVAVAGFGEDDLEVTVKENTLTIAGKITRDEREDAEKRYLHRGIAGRAFKLNFALADAVHVRAASNENGLLNVDLERVVPEAAKPRTIEISRDRARRVLEDSAA